jgi:UDP-glucose 4-epimerase
MKNKKVAVTGGLGFIGSHLIGRLNENNDVVIVDDQTSGNIKNIEELDFTKIDTDFSDITQAKLEMIFEDVDYVFHMAAVTSVLQSVNDPLRSNEVNITGTLKVLEAAKNCDVKKLILSSSSAVYGETETVPISEKYPMNPLSPYAVTKATGELYCRVYSEIYDLSTIALRYFNVFGPKQDPKSEYAAVIPIFIDKLLKNESPIIYGDGEQTRDFISVKQVVEANILAAKSNEIGSYNIGLGKSTSINQLFEMIKEIMGKDINPIYENERAGEIKHSVADISKAKSIGYTPKNDFIEELTETIEWFKNNRNI